MIVKSKSLLEFSLLTLRSTVVPGFPLIFETASSRLVPITGTLLIYVIKSPDSRKFGLSPIPDKVYRVFFYAYDLPTELSAHGDQLVFPKVYKTVLLARARYYVHQFKENPQAAAFALEDYRRGLRLMKLNLMEAAPGYFKDDRIRFL